MNIKSFIIESIETIVISIIVLTVIYSTIAIPEMVYGSSMEPNFKTGDRILVDRISKLFNNNFERGEIIVFNNSNDHLIKRIIGVPGDIFKIYQCNVYISNGTESYKLDEYYLGENVCTKGSKAIKEGRSFKIPENHYVALGDNREFSHDSRAIGMITPKDVIGRVVLRFWPIDKMEFIN